jgi:hypothetical protein
MTANEALQRLKTADALTVSLYQKLRETFTIVEAFERATATRILLEETVGCEFELIRDPNPNTYAARDELGNHYVVHLGLEKPWEIVEEVTFRTWPPSPSN